MKAYPVKEIIRNFLSVVAGVLLAAIFFWLFFILALPLLFAEEPSSHHLYKQGLWLLLAGLITGSLAGGFLTVMISTRADWIHALITGVVVTFLYGLIMEFEWDFRAIESGLIYFLLAPLVLTGAWLGKRYKRIRTSNRSSPPGNP